MATVDMTAGSNATSLGGGVIRIANTVDLKAAAAAKGSALVSTDIIECLDIPKNMHVSNVFVRTKVAAAGTTLTATVGDGATANGWDASIDLKAAAGTVTCGVGGTDAFKTAGKLYSTADTIDLVLTVSTITDPGVFDIIAECFDPTYV